METINIAFSSDNNYAPFMGVALCSIFENKREGYLIDVYVLDGGIKEINKNKLKILENKYNFKITYIKIDTMWFKDFYISGYFTQATYYRIMIPDLLPNIDKILYLDCDIVAINDILELYNINIKDYFFGAVEDKGYISKFFVNYEKIPKGTKYFNAGVMLLNLDKWREIKINKTILDFINEKRDQLNNHDQDAINSILFGKWLDIPYKYNYTSMIATLHPVDYEKIENSITIIHYTGLKPWNYYSKNNLDKKYLDYLEKTPWKNIKYINKNIKNVFIKSLILIVYYIFPKTIVEKLKCIKNKLKIKFY